MAKETVLVVGGAGYIGSHINNMLHKAGYSTVVYDNFSKSKRIKGLKGAVVEGDLSDRHLLNQVFEDYSIDAVMHFAAWADVGESVREPLAYYKNNVGHTITLLEAMERHGVVPFVFSSSAAIFGHPLTPLITEEHPKDPINPYGMSKLMVEKLLNDLTSIRSCSLRYFNATGGDPRGELANPKRQQSNLIPIALDNQQRGQPLMINGTDYPTHDGTCVRDYIHLEDLGNAHLLGLRHLLDGGSSCAYNLGNGQGFSIRDVVNSIERVTNRSMPVEEGPRRAGDPATLVASAEKIQQELGWAPRYGDLDTMVLHTWQALQIS